MRRVVRLRRGYVLLTSMATQYNPTNEAILGLLRLSWSQEVEDQITAAYGPAVAAEVKALYQFVVHRPVEVREAYPFLTPAAAAKLAKCFWLVRLW
jgi:hypothetical protein